MADRTLRPAQTRRARALRAAAAVAIAAVAAGCGLLDDDPNTADDDTATTLSPAAADLPEDASTALIRFGDAEPGEIVGLRAAGGTTVEWVNRETGEMFSADVNDTATTRVIAEIAVATLGQDWGLLDTAVLPDGRRFASWTQPGSGDFDNGNLVVGEIVDGTAVSVVWNVGRIASTGIGGQLDVGADGSLVLAIGGEAGWADDNATRGALVSIDPDGGQDQEPVILSEGYADPQAFLVGDDGEIWVWDRAGERDPDEPAVADVERYGRADLGDRSELTRNEGIDHDPTALVELPDGRLAVCGSADGALRAHEPTNDRTTLAAEGEAIMVCASGAAVLDDGTIVTIATIDGTETLHVRRP